MRVELNALESYRADIIIINCLGKDISCVLHDQKLACMGESNSCNFIVFFLFFSFVNDCVKRYKTICSTYQSLEKKINVNKKFKRK